MPLTRSQTMARNKGKNTRPELFLRRALYAAGLRYRLHHKTPAGRPDIVFPGPKVAVFVDGCFWHGCPEHYVRPRSRDEFWTEKRRGNLDRDRRQTLKLMELGWTVIRVWEHEVWQELDAVVTLVIGAVRRAEPRTGEQWRVARVEVIDPQTDLERRHQESLLDGEVTRIVERVRSTRKARRPKGS